MKSKNLKIKNTYIYIIQNYTHIKKNTLIKKLKALQEKAHYVS